MKREEKQVLKSELVNEVTYTFTKEELQKLVDFIFGSVSKLTTDYFEMTKDKIIDDFPSFYREHEKTMAAMTKALKFYDIHTTPIGMSWGVLSTKKD